MNAAGPRGALAGALGWFQREPLVVALLTAFGVVAGLLVAPFPWDVAGLPRDPVPVDAIPDTAENQQIVFTEWPGRSPQDVEDQVTYPLTVSLLGVAGVESIRSTSMFGFSSIYVIFEEGYDFYASRSRLVEKLASLPPGTLPGDVSPRLGPDATALGQVFWYTLEGWTVPGEGEPSRPAGGFDLAELRSIQDFDVRYALASVSGVAEVASIGGHVREYQVDVDPDRMRAHGVTLDQVFRAVADSNLDVGARTFELNRAEYVLRGLGFLESVQDLESVVVRAAEGVPITLRQIADVGVGPAQRRGVLDKAGVEAVGGVVVARYGANPLEVIEAVKREIDAIAPSLPRRRLDDGTEVQVRVVPFYDRSGLIGETLGTLEHALRQQVLVAALVVLVMVARVRVAALVAGLLPLAVLGSFVAMRLVGVDANVVSLAGIAIAVGTLVDVGIVLMESVLQHLAPDQSPRERFRAVHRGASEVAGAVTTAVATTVVGFLPVFAMSGPEGKLFTPLAYTKTFALVASIAVALVVVPAAAYVLFRTARLRSTAGPSARIPSVVLALVAAVVLAGEWRPLGPAAGLGNLALTGVLLGVPLLGFWLVLRSYEAVLRFCLAHKVLFLSLPLLLVAAGGVAWLGFDRVFGWLPRSVALSRPAVDLRHAFPGLGKEFLPRLDEGSFLLMPIAMSHASIGEALDLLQQTDRAIRAIPEVDQVVGKIGRVDSALDPAPIGMVETVVTYVPEYATGERGEILTFAWDALSGRHVRDADGRLVPDDDGRPFRQWRDEIESPRDIWDAIASAARVPGLTSASMLQPLETRRIMLQTGMRATLGVKVFGPDLATLERAALDLERELARVPGVAPGTVVADRVVGKPYLEIDLDREALARYGLSVRAVQHAIEVAVGGRPLTTTVEGRERYPVRARYPRELREDADTLARVLVPTPTGAQVPLGQLADLRYAPGPQSIKSEDTRLVAYVLFDKAPGETSVELVERARSHLESELGAGRLELPAGVTYRFAGDYENQLHAAATLRLVVPVALFVIFLLLYLLFRSVATTLIVFSGVFVAWAGGFLLVWLYGQPWFLDVEAFGVDLRELFQVGPVALSVAVWVGFLALFGIATDDGVVLATYLDQSVARTRPTSVAEVREAVVAAGLRRIRPCLMTSATTILALLPVLTSRGRGADVMLPMAIPSVGGMLLVGITVFVVPTLYAWRAERAVRRSARDVR